MENSIFRRADVISRKAQLLLCDSHWNWPQMVLLWVLGAFLAVMAVLGMLVVRTLMRWANPALPPVPAPSRSGNKKAYSAENPEVVIIGGGVVGATMAVQFGKQGRHTVVIERQMQAPDRIVGEFLQPGGYNMMVKLGIEGTRRLKNLPEARKWARTSFRSKRHFFPPSSLGWHLYTLKLP